MKTVLVSDRLVNFGDALEVGVQTDNAVEVIAFKGLPTLGEGQIATLNWVAEGDDARPADNTPLAHSEGMYTFTVPNTMTQYGGYVMRAHIHVEYGSQKWNTREFSIRVFPVANTGGAIAEFIPDAFQELKARLDYGDKRAYGYGVNAMYPPSPYVAAVGDGSTDDTAAIQALLDSFDDVMLPASAGGYLVTSLTIKRYGSRLRGASSGISSNVRVAQILSGSPGYAIKISKNLYHVCLRDLTVSNVNADRSGGVGGIDLNYNGTVSADHNGKIMLDNVSVRHMSIAGITSNLQTWDNFLRNVYVYECDGNGIEYGGTDSSFEGVYVSYCAKNGIVLGGGNNSLDNIKTYFCGSSAGSHYGFVIGNSGQNRINNMSIQQNYKGGLYVGSDMNQIDNLTVDGNGYLANGNAYSAIAVAGNRNRIRGVVNGFWVGGSVKYGLSLSGAAYAGNDIDLIVDDYYRSMAVDTGYEGLPAISEINQPWINPMNQVKINGEDAETGVTWLDALDNATYTPYSYNVTSAVINADKSVTITPLSTSNDGNYKMRLLPAFTSTKPVILVKMRLRGCTSRAYHARIGVDVSLDSTTHNYFMASSYLSDIYAGERWCWFYLDMSTLGIDLSALYKANLALVVSKTGKPIVGGETIEILSAKFAFVAKNNAYEAPSAYDF